MVDINKLVHLPLNIRQIVTSDSPCELLIDNFRIVKTDERIEVRYGKSVRLFSWEDGKTAKKITKIKGGIYEEHIL